MSFKSFGLSPNLLQAVEEMGYTNPTPIQLQAIPLVLEGSDLLAGAQTGTGKTAGFTLPLLENLLKKSKETGSIRALILTPTRELASQVEENVRSLSKHLSFKSTVVFGGINIKGQMNKLKAGVDILVATPGRLLDLVNQKAANLSEVEILVLDEADRMLDMGFIHDIKKILALLPKKRQTLLFSATFSPEIKTLANDFLTSPKLVQVAAQNSTAEGVSQRIHPVDSKRKQELLSFLINSNQWKQVLVFTRTKHGANRLTKQLESHSITASAIHGNKSQGARTKALDDFKNGQVTVLVATDIAARGLDIDQLPHVVNFDLPNVPEDYVHRIGRTGRAGNNGEAVSLVCIDEHDLLHDIEKLLKIKIPKMTIPGYEPDPSIKPEPLVKGRLQSSAGSRADEPRRSNSGQSRSNRSGPSRDGNRSDQPRGERNFNKERDGNRSENRTYPPRDGNRSFPPKDGNRSYPPKDRDGNRADQPRGERTYPPRDGNRSFPPRDGNRSFPPRDGNRSYPPKDRDGNRADQPRGERTYPPRDGNRSFTPRDGNRSYPPRERDGNRSDQPRGERTYPPRDGNRSFPPRDGNRSFPPRERDGNRSDQPRGERTYPPRDSNRSFSRDEGRSFPPRDRAFPPRDSNRPFPSRDGNRFDQPKGESSFSQPKETKRTYIPKGDIKPGKSRSESRFGQTREERRAEED